VDSLFRAEKHWAPFLGLIADGDDFVEGLVQISLQRLAFLGADINTELGHGTNRQWPYEGRFSPSRERLEAVAPTWRSRPSAI
jgi:hypothetical protein